MKKVQSSCLEIAGGIGKNSYSELIKQKTEQSLLEKIFTDNFPEMAKRFLSKFVKFLCAYLKRKRLIRTEKTELNY